jgi:hypothetical protein
MPGSWTAREFPNLKDSDYKITSEYSEEYNCLAWAVGDVDQRWDPDEMDQYYWPPGVPREVTVAAVVAAFQTKGFEPSPDSSLEEGIEKIAIYATSDGRPTHAARQLKNGHWTSKLGNCEDVEHETLDCLTGEVRDAQGRIMCYGRPVCYMRRPRE